MLTLKRAELRVGPPIGLDRRVQHAAGDRRAVDPALADGHDRVLLERVGPSPRRHRQIQEDRIPPAFHRELVRRQVRLRAIDRVIREAIDQALVGPVETLVFGQRLACE